jgi:serine/threonine protein kinase
LCFRIYLIGSFITALKISFKLERTSESVADGGDSFICAWNSFTMEFLAAWDNAVLSLQGLFVAEVPNTFGARYRLEEELGRGAFSVVQRATRLQHPGEDVAVKVITRKDLSLVDEEYIRSETEILQSLDYPNIVKCYDFFEENEYFYMVLEIVKGGELFDRIVKKLYYSEKEARDLVEMLLSTIKYCHDRHIVHRDLKPENLLLVSKDNDEAIKLADFGLAARAEGNVLEGFCGSPGYISPEIIMDKPHGKPVDMWAIGVIMYVLLGGYLPFDDIDRMKTNRLIKKGQFEFHAEYWSAVSDEAKDLIRGLLTVDQTTRLTADQALQHKWINLSAEELNARNLTDTTFAQLKRFNARRKFRAVGRALIAAIKWAKLLKKPLSTIEDITEAAKSPRGRSSKTPVRGTSLKLPAPESPPKLDLRSQSLGTAIPKKQETGSI